MLHRADAPYVTGRSDVLLKLKPFDDAEAVVVAHLPGRGRLAGKLLRRSIQALAEGRDPGDLTTIEDPSALDQVRAAVSGA